jgi:enamine deaminase RidA (YjgF/YER057c/UK114 family)
MPHDTERVNAGMLETALQTRQTIWPEGFARPPFAYSPGVRAGGWVFASAQMATDLVNGLDPEARINQRNPYLKDPVELQSWALMRNLSEVFKAAGADISDHSVRIQQWRVSERPTLAELEAGNTWTGLSVSPYYRARNSYISEPRPASTGMGVRRLLLSGGLIGVDMIAIHPDAAPGKHGVGVPEGVPSPLAGYSPAICNGDWVFLAHWRRRPASTLTSGTAHRSRRRRGTPSRSSSASPPPRAPRSTAASRRTSTSRTRKSMREWTASGASASPTIRLHAW